MNMVTPNWPAPKNVKAFSSTRWGWVSKGAYQCLNLCMHVGDDDILVQKNRDLVKAGGLMPTSPIWLNQTHSNVVVELTKPTHQVINADGSMTTHNKIVCTVMTADCLPVLLTNTDGTQVAAVHAGWRGLADGILENAVNKFTKPSQVMAWIGPAIGAKAFEVGSDVFDVFTHFDSHARDAFVRYSSQVSVKGSQKKWLANMSLLATQRLNLAGVEQVFNSQRCTFSEPENFYSYRRDGMTGRQATFIWIE